MKKLFEEFKEYENLWEDVSTEGPEAKSAADPYAEFNLSNSVEEALDNFPDDFEIVYDGYTANWEDDAWDYEREEHTTVSRSRKYDDFTYRVSAKDVWEVLRDSIIDEYIDKPGYLEKAFKYYASEFLSPSWADESIADLKKVVADYKKLQELQKTDDEAGDKTDIYIADQLDSFFVLFELPLKEYYKDLADNAR